MKKNLFICLLLAIVGIMATGCDSCKSENKKQGKEAKELALTPETAISTDKEAMYLRTSENHTLKWMQTGATLTAFLTDEGVADATFMEVTNGFQTQWPSEDGKGMYTKVTLITTNTMVTDSIVSNGAFYFDNIPLNDKEINITFKQAIERILQANCPKPMTRVIVLRSPLGPVSIEDAYYIAVDCYDEDIAVFVNARTGEVSTSNPAWPK